MDAVSALRIGDEVLFRTGPGAWSTGVIEDRLESDLSFCIRDLGTDELETVICGTEAADLAVLLHDRATTVEVAGAITRDAAGDDRSDDVLPPFLLHRLMFLSVPEVAHTLQLSDVLATVRQ